VKRALFISILAAFGAISTIACSGNPDVLTDGSSKEPAGATDGNTDESTSTKKSDTKTPVATPAEKPKAEPPKPSTNTDQCKAGGDDPTTCAKCCAQKHSPAQGCACGTGSKCGDACGDNLCTGGLPSLECGMCMFQSQCDFGFGGADGAGGGLGDLANNELAQCVQQCAPKK
jgi:hypothetical protein